MIGREIIIQHVAGCAVCGWLSRFAIRRRDPALLEAAIRLRGTHAENDTEREAFARSCAHRTRPVISLGETRADAGSEVPITVVSSKTEGRRGRRDA